MYKTAQRESQKNSLFTVDCHQTILNKANKSLKTIRKKRTHNRSSALERLVINQWVGAEVQSRLAYRQCLDMIRL